MPNFPPVPAAAARTIPPRALLLLVADLRDQSLVIPRYHWAKLAVARCFYLVL